MACIPHLKGRFAYDAPLVAFALVDTVIKFVAQAPIGILCELHVSAVRVDKLAWMIRV